jgi:hypothetical protein
MPARQLIREYAPEYYINFRRPLPLLETARGCPFKCNFCSVWRTGSSTTSPTPCCPTKLPLDEFYREYAGLWQHALDVRYQHKGRMKSWMGLMAALATGKVAMSALRKGMRIGMGGNVLANPESFLRAHRESERRIAEMRDVLAEALAAA